MRIVTWITFTCLLATCQAISLGTLRKSVSHSLEQFQVTSEAGATAPTCAPGALLMAPADTRCDSLSSATAIAGIYGGGGGVPFSDQSMVRYISPSIRSVRIRAGAYVDSIQINYDGMWGALHGGSGGAPNSFDLPPGEYIVQVFGRASAYVDQINFRTSKGRVFGPYGGPGGMPFSASGPSGYALSWLDGRSSVFVDQLRFMFAKTVEMVAPATSQPSTVAPAMKPTTPPTTSPTSTIPTMKPTTPPTSPSTTVAPSKPTVPLTCPPGAALIAPNSASCAPVSVATNIMGTYGGGGGGAFSDQSFVRYISPSIRSVRIRAGAYVDSIQINYDGMWGPLHGGSGGAPNSFDLQPGEYIISVFGRASAFIDQINFRTSKGRVFGPYGGPGGSPFMVNAPTGYALSWVNGRSSVFVDQLQFVISKTPAL